MQFPEIKQLDLATPISMYYAAKRQGEQDAAQGQTMRDQSELTRLKLDEYKRTSPQRINDEEIAAKLKAVSTDKALTEFGYQNLASLDPEAEDFDQQAVQAVGVYTTVLHDQYGFSKEQADRVAEYIIKSGGITREAVKKRQVEQGIRPDKKQQIVNGQLVTLEGDKATAAPIEGFQQKANAETTLGKLIAERDSLPPGSQARALYDQAIAKETTASKGQRFSTTLPDGTVIAMDQGGDGSGLGKQAENKVQTKMLDASNAVSRLSEIKKSFGETAQTYLTAGGKAKLAKIDLMLKSGVNVPQEDQEFVKGVSSFASKALANLNTTLNELSGAAVTQQEYERIAQTLPDPGKKGITNVLSGDNAVEFEAKMNEAIRMQQMALARLSYIDRNGLTVGKNRKGEITGFFDEQGGSVTLDKMPQIMKQRANEIAAEMIKNNPNASKVQLAPAIQQAISQEFGLVVGAPSGDVLEPQPLMMGQ